MNSGIIPMGKQHDVPRRSLATLNSVGLAVILTKELSERFWYRYGVLRKVGIWNFEESLPDSPSLRLDNGSRQFRALSQNSRREGHVGC
jgi:hypothetical protein